MPISVADAAPAAVRPPIATAATIPGFACCVPAAGTSRRASAPDPTASSTSSSWDLREAATRVEFLDVAAVIHFLRKVVWTVPDFSFERYRDRLRALHEVIECDGRFGAHSQRYLIEARRPG
jgi:hypothetical protein